MVHQAHEANATDVTGQTRGETKGEAETGDETGKGGRKRVGPPAELALLTSLKKFLAPREGKGGEKGVKRRMGEQKRTKRGKKGRKRG